MKKAVKGQYGYIEYQRRVTVFRTIFMFAVSFALLFTGIRTTGDKKNLLTVVAVLGCLPASKSLVNMIMFLKAKGCSAEVKAAVEKYGQTLTQLFDMKFTSYEKSYPISHMVVKGMVVCGYTEDSACDCMACEKHLDALLKQGGCKGATVKIYNDLKNYCEGLENLANQEEEEASEDVMINLLSIAL